MSQDQEFKNKPNKYVKEWQKVTETIEALVNLIDPNRNKIHIRILSLGEVVLEHKKSGSTMRITNVKSAIKDITYFVNNDPAKNFTEEMTQNENVVRNKR